MSSDVCVRAAAMQTHAMAGAAAVWPRLRSRLAGWLLHAGGTPAGGRCGESGALHVRTHAAEGG